MKLAMFVEALLKLRVRDPLVLGEGVVCLGEREHVGVDASSEMLEGDPQRPEAAVSADHRRRGGEQPTKSFGGTRVA